MNNKLIAGVLILIAVLIAGFILLGNKSSTGNVIKGDGERPVKEFSIESFTEVIDGKYYPQFSQKEITVNKGDLVRIKVLVTSGMHDFKIDEFNVYSETPLDKEVTIEFTTDKSGEFVYYCAKPGHRALGQWGTLKVLE